jgi:uncharacterized protein (DUF1330 family)
MAHYSVVSVTPKSTDWIAPYLHEVTPLVAKHGGRYLARTASHAPLEGSAPPPALQVIIEWPSPEAEAAFHSDPAYRAPLASRLAASESQWSSIKGKDDFAE